MSERRLFILEDDPARISYFKETFGLLADLTIIDSCADADKFRPPYDVIFLDHDLGGRQLVEHEDCGLTFVRKVQALAEASPCLTIIHSYNADGAKAMQNLLPESIHAPFRGLMFNSAVDLLKRMWRLDAK